MSNTKKPNEKDLLAARVARLERSAEARRRVCGRLLHLEMPGCNHLEFSFDGNQVVVNRASFGGLFTRIGTYKRKRITAISLNGCYALMQWLRDVEDAR